MTDFHSHILPGMDDGSSSVEESMEMLRLSQSQGITKIVATPHFYAEREAPEHFLKRRDRAMRHLEEAIRTECADKTDPTPGTRSESFPEILYGAEVCYYTGITRTSNLRQLCIGNTGILLLEMPFHKWSGRMIDEVIELAQDDDLIILLAHIDRYLADQSRDTWDTLMEEGVLFQVNASAFLGGWLTRRKAFRLLREEKIAVLGSDCHNMEARKPNLGDALAQIEQKEGKKAVRRLATQAEELLERKARA